MSFKSVSNIPPINLIIIQIEKLYLFFVSLVIFQIRVPKLMSQKAVAMIIVGVRKKLENINLTV